ncbi:MAG: hypothetical protein ACTSSH_12675 [Candidatus Heimdallarchaeota archaeon]
MVVIDTWVKEFLIKLGNSSVENLIIKVTFFDRSHNLIIQEMRLDGVLITTLTVEQINSFLKLDTRSLSFSIFIFSVVFIDIAVRKITLIEEKKIRFRPRDQLFENQIDF